MYLPRRIGSLGISDEPDRCADTFNCRRKVIAGVAAGTFS